MTIFRIYIFSICIAFTSFVYALRPDALITQHPHDQWGSSSGLGSESIFSVVQTKDGYLWVATSSGLSRFNGRGFRNFNAQNTPELKVNGITVLLQDRDGSLWVGTDGGGLLNYKQDKFKTFTIEDGLSDNSITGLAQDGQGNVWVLTPVELNLYAKGKFSSVPLEHVHCVFADENGALIGTETGFSVYEKEKYAHHAGPPVTAIYRNAKGGIWLGIQNQGLSKWVENKIDPVLQTEAILSLLEDSDGVLWIGTQRGLQKFVKESATYPLIHSSVTSLLEDHERSLWVATKGEGLYRFRPSAFITLGFREGLRNLRTCCVLQGQDQTVWVGTEDGVSNWKNGEFTNYDLPEPVQTMAIDSSQNLWVGTQSEILRWNGSSFTSAIPKISAKIIVAAPDGTLWIGSTDGLRKFSNGKLTQVAEEEITDLLIDQQQNLWVGTTSGLKQWAENGLHDPLFSAPVLCLKQDQDGTLWSGTPDGIYRIRNGRLIGGPNGKVVLPSIARAILPDDLGNLWISTQGIIRANLKNERSEFLSFNTSNGLRAIETSDGKPASWKTSDGNLWFATVNGISTINPKSFFRNKIPPPVVIEGMEVDRLPVKDLGIREIKLPKGSSRIEFQYAGLSFLPPVQYRYVLKGFDQFWTNAGGQTRAVYTNLPPGKYVFKVLASNNNEIWNIAGAALPFEIEGTVLTPDRFSRWFPLATGLIGLLAGWFLAKFSSKKKLLIH